MRAADRTPSAAWTITRADSAVLVVGRREPRAAVAGEAWVPAASAEADLVAADLVAAVFDDSDVNRNMHRDKQEEQHNV